SNIFPIPTHPLSVAQVTADWTMDKDDYKYSESNFPAYKVRRIKRSCELNQRFSSTQKNSTFVIATKTIDCLY
ncbi:hypothetical protein MAR_036713, partial [Mya arenaria]